MSESNNPRDFANEHYWPADHFSVPASTRCFHMAPSPNTDCWCIREAGHAGAHEYEWAPLLRTYSWKDPRP